MYNWTFVFNPLTDNVEIEEPANWSEIEFEITRDKNFHGISVAYTNKDLTFYGKAALFLMEQRKLFGVDAAVELYVTGTCDEVLEFEETFKLNFAEYSAECGKVCKVFIPIEETGCAQLFRNRYEQKVDIDSEVALDGTTEVLRPATMVKHITLLPKAMQLENTAKPSTDPDDNEPEIISEQPDWFTTEFGNFNNAVIGHIAPALPIVEMASLGSMLTSSYSALFNGGDQNQVPIEYPCTVNTEELFNTARCALSSVHVSARYKGLMEVSGGQKVTLILTLSKLPAGKESTDINAWVLVADETMHVLNSPLTSKVVDASMELDIDLVQGDRLYYSIFMRSSQAAEVAGTFTLTQHPETFFKITANSLCEETEADVHMIYETVQHAAALMTNDCIQLESNYYGRTDSMHSYAADGIGSLKTLTSGLKIRQQPDAKFFISMREIMEGLRAVDNIGFAIEKRDTDTFLVLEEVAHFYPATEIMVCDSIPKATTKNNGNEFYSVINVGYDKWQAERVNSLDEFLSTREYRPSLQNVSDTFEIICKFVAAGYVIELARLETFAQTGKADTRYDNDTFIICVKRDGADIAVEQGNIAAPSNLIGADTVYNFRISPVRNLMRWWKSLAGMFPAFADGQLLFSAGTGNFIAEGQLSDSNRLEKIVLAENNTIKADVFESSLDARPITRPETIQFEYPMSLAEFKRVRANPYGYIRYQCGDSEFEKAYISKVRYRLTKQIATFELRNKY